MQTPKSQLINGNSEIILYLIGGSTKAMMKDNKISFITSLVAEDDITKKETKYRVVNQGDYTSPFLFYEIYQILKHSLNF